MKIKMLKILAAPVVLLLISSFTPASGEEISEKGISAAVVPELTASGVLGYPVNISCKSENDYPLRSCRWERLKDKDGRRHIVNINSHGLNQGSSNSSNNDCNYHYVGVGLEKGDCTISINNTTEFHAEQWECLLIGTPIDHTWIGRLRIELKSFENAIGLPYFETGEKNGDFINITYDGVSPARRNITCCVHNDARIPLTFQIHLGNNASSQQFTKESVQEKQACSSELFEFVPQNNSNRLKCSAVYIYNQTMTYIKKAEIPIHVKFGPQISTSSPVQKLNGSDALITIEFSANPTPQLSWFLTTDVENKGPYYIGIRNNTKYTMTFVAMKDNNYTATLQLKDVNHDDSTRQFKLRISNAYGTKELSFRIVTPNPGDESDAYWMMILIGIGAALICFIFFIVLFIILAGKRNDSYSPASVVYSNSSRDNHD